MDLSPLRAYFFTYTKQRGKIQIFLLLGMLIMAVSLPIATRLAQKNQENRSSATQNKSYDPSPAKTTGKFHRQALLGGTIPVTHMIGIVWTQIVYRAIGLRGTTTLAGARRTTTN